MQSQTSSTPIYMTLKIVIYQPRIVTMENETIPNSMHWVLPFPKNPTQTIIDGLKLEMWGF